MSRRTIALAVFLTAGVVVASEVSARIGMRPAAVIPYSAAAATESKPPTSERTLKWQACGEGPAECAVLRVPIVHGGAGGAAIGIKVIRVRARSPKRRIGVLVVNPGGPGAAVINFTKYFASAIDASVADRFDIIGFDPRGIGQSAPIRCENGPTLDRFQHLDPHPDDPAETQALLDGSRTFAQDCYSRNPALLGHVGTVDVVKDMDLLREALGEEQISFFGFSYGSTIGLTYAEIFPHRIRAMVLDGVLDPAVSLDERNRLQALGFEQNLTAFLADCARRTSCLFHHEGHSREAFDRLFQQIDRVSIPVGARAVGPAEFTAAVFSQLYNSSRGWPRLEKLLKEAEHGNGSPALARYDAYVDRNPDGTYDNTNEANLAVNCSDLAASNDPKHLEDEAATLAQQAPTFGPAAVWYMAPCTFWPVAPTPVPVGPAHGAPTILLVGNTSDPATPYVWAQQVAARLADSVLLTYNHTGHTAYNGGSTCIRTRVDSYLLAQQAPPPGTVCN